MKGKPKKNQREKDITSRYMSGRMDEDRMEQGQKFTARNKGYQQDKIMKTALLRAAEEEISGDIEGLPVGQVIEVHSRFIQVQKEGEVFLCVVRKTLNKVNETGIVVGDLVRIREMGAR